MPTYRETIGAPDPVTEYGKGVTVALVDTGVADVPDLEGRARPSTASARATASATAPSSPGIIAGNGTFTGVAPAATLLDVQVADEKGNTSLCKVLQGLEIASDERRRRRQPQPVHRQPPSPRVRSAVPRPRATVGQGVTVVVAAGNDGPDDGHRRIPGQRPRSSSLWVRWMRAPPQDRDDDSVAEFSSRGNQVYDGQARPGRTRRLAGLDCRPGQLARQRNPESHVGDGYMRGIGNLDVRCRGVAARWPRVLSANPDSPPNGVKALLTATAYSTAPETTAAGAGALDLGDALDVAEGCRTAIRGTQQSPDADAGEWGPNEDDAEAWADVRRRLGGRRLRGRQGGMGGLSWQTQQWAHAHGRSPSSPAASVRMRRSSRPARGQHAPGPRRSGWRAPGRPLLVRPLLDLRRVAGALLGRPLLERTVLGRTVLARRTSGWRGLDRSVLERHDPGQARSVGVHDRWAARVVGSRGLGATVLGRPFLGHGLVGRKVMESDQLICLTDCGTARSGPDPQPGRAVSTYTQQSPPVHREVAGVCALGAASALAALVLSMTRWSECGNLDPRPTRLWELRPWLVAFTTVGRWPTSGFATAGRIEELTFFEVVLAAAILLLSPTGPPSRP